MSAPAKLTKKQKKGLAFRERKGKGKAKEIDDDNAVPVMEDQDSMEDKAEDHNVEAQSQVADVPESVAPVATKKRKRVEEDGLEKDKPEGKKKKKSTGVAAGKEGTAEKSAEKKPSEKKATSKQRYILFVGNLKYTTSREAIQRHFAKCDPPPDVRLMTPKPSASGKPVTKSKGCAFLEFSHRNALQQGLKLHQSELEGRKINVELTAGGGGKSESRLEKVKKRNRELHEQRTQKKPRTHQDGVSKTKGDTRNEVQPERPQRYSTTSGVDQIPLNKRTWTVGDGDETGDAKRSKKKARVPRALGTGVNAIPVG